MNETMYMISESELKDLLTAYYTLMALEHGGVDNWEGYGWSIGDFIKDWLYERKNEFNCDMSDMVDEFSIEDIANYEIIEYDEVI
jgi:hypothetical protein